MKTPRVAVALLVAGLVATAAALCTPRVRHGLARRLFGPRLLQSTLEHLEPEVRQPLLSYFSRANVTYPPKRVTLVALKQERRLEVYAADGKGDLRFITAYPILAASGRLGPKLCYGDMQVPEGFYEVESLNPQSKFHLALRLNYPSRFDREQARRDGRDDPGKDIMIHGGAVSIGCVAIGDEAIEEVFKLAADTGIERVDVIMSPVDFRRTDLPPDAPEFPQWVRELHDRIAEALAQLPPQEQAP